MKTTLLALEVILALLSWGFLRYIQNRVTEEIVDWDLDRRLAKTIKRLWICNPMEIVLRVVQNGLNVPATPTFSMPEIVVTIFVYLLLAMVFVKTLSIQKIINQVKDGPWEEPVSKPEIPWYVRN